jgi:hypothetical protein
MNERIQKLIEQATTIEYGVDNGFDRVTFDKEKFAELIVHECAAIGERYADGNYEVRNQIMAQFGLEEPEE